MKGIRQTGLYKLAVVLYVFAGTRWIDKVVIGWHGRTNSVPGLPTSP
jgi:hypothetical protein